MIVLPPSRQRWLASILIAAFAAALGWFVFVSNTPVCERVKQASYDTLHMFSPLPALSNSEVVIVYLDLQSYIDEKQDPALPWPRELHARLLDRLTASGARAVVFDIVFAYPGPNPEADAKLETAIRQNGRVILAGEYNNQIGQGSGEEQPGARLHRWNPPYEPFAKAAAAWGVAEQHIDDDFVVRGYLAGLPQSGLPSLTWAAANWLKIPRSDQSTSLPEANQHWVRYYGRPLTIPFRSFSRALSPGDVPDDFFRNKIVFIGGRSMVGVGGQRQDEFRTPFRFWNSQDVFMPGVEVNAMELMNLLRQDWLLRSSAEPSLILVTALLGGFLVWLRPTHAAGVGLFAAALSFGLSRGAFQHGTWFSWLIPVGLQLPAAFGGSLLFYTVDWWRARQRYEIGKRIAEAKIRQQATLIDKARDAIWLQALDGKVLYANPSVERLYGWTLPELQRAEVLQQLFAPDPVAVEKARQTALATGEWNGELVQRTKSGRLVTVASRWTLIAEESAGSSTLLQINTDITERKELESQFLRTQRMNTIGSLAGGMAHDLNNALAPILMGVQLLRRQTGDEESQRLLGVMEANTHRSAEMVRQVLLFARGRGGDFQRLELPPLIAELERIVRETFPRNVQVEKYVPRDLWFIDGNTTQLHQVLLNLCVNARDAMPLGGKLTFVADNVELAADELPQDSEAKPGKYVSLSVSDTGTGMPPEIKAKIFEPFFTTKGEGQGTGIGLATVLRIVKGHGGFLRVDSEPGAGTTFEIFFPASLDTSAPPESEAALEIPRGNGELVLVVDDERAIRELVAESLRAHGYSTITAANGKEAVELFQQHRDKVRVLFTDSAMPVMGGTQAIEEIRRLKPTLPVVLASGEKLVSNGEVARGILLLSKPFSLAEILRAIHQILPRPKQD